MSGVPASSRSFNGGTITQPLVIASTNPSAIPFEIRASWNAQNVDFFAITNTDTNTRLLAVDSQGQTLAFIHTSEAQRSLVAGGSAPDTGSIGGGAVVGRVAAGVQQASLYGAVPTTQPTAIANAAGGVVIDTEARAALNALLAAMRTVGLIAT